MIDPLLVWEIFCIVWHWFSLFEVFGDLHCNKLCSKSTIWFSCDYNYDGISKRLKMRRFWSIFDHEDVSVRAWNCFGIAAFGTHLKNLWSDLRCLNPRFCWLRNRFFTDEYLLFFQYQLILLQTNLFHVPSLWLCWSCLIEKWNEWVMTIILVLTYNEWS